MVLLRRFLVPALRDPEVLGHAFAESVGLVHVELRVGIALVGERPPFGDGGTVVAGVPGIDAALDVGGGRRRAEPCRGRGNENVPTMVHRMTPPKALKQRRGPSGFSLQSSFI